MIRLVLEKDIDEVMDIWLKTNISAHYFIPENYWIGNFEAVKGDYLPKNENYVFEEDGEIKGFISVIKNYFIGALFVSMEYQKHGIGRKLIDHVKNLYSHLELAVYVENGSAVDFYKKCGFSIKKQQKNKDSGYPEYIMEWKK